MSFTMFNSLSQVVASDILRNGNSKIIDVNGWNAGLYFIRFEDGTTKKIIVN